MARSSLLVDLISSLLRPRRGTAGAGRRGPGRFLVLEPLEGRTLLATIPVTSLADAGPGSLRAAIEQADLDPNQDTITFAPSVTGTIVLSTALPDLSTNIAIAGPGPSVLTVARSGVDGTPAFRIFTVAVGAEVTISGLTITGGLAVSGGGISNSGTLTVSNSNLSGNRVFSSIGGSGGGIYNTGTLTVINSNLSGNSADGPNGTGFGGGLSNRGTVTIDASTVSGNTARSGGGIHNDGMMTIDTSTISGNSTPVGLGYGGGIHNDGTMMIDASTVTGNTATYTGGGLSNLGTVTLTNSTLSGNSAGVGGGIGGGGTLSLTSSTLSGNTASDAGGGIHSYGTAMLTDCTLSGNSASDGGGIHGASFVTLTLTDCTLSGNSASNDGGGIWSIGTLTVTNSTFSGNSASDGGGLSNLGTVTLTNSTLSGNSADRGGAVYTQLQYAGYPVAKVTTTTSLFANPAGGSLVSEAGTVFVSLGHNLFSDAPGVALDPTDLINTDPLLGPLADNGGPTLTQTLLPGSPAIDAGVPIAGVTTDQRGVPRPQGIAPDIGAFEPRGFNLAIVGGDGQRTPIGSPFPAPLAVAVASPFGEPVAGGRVTFTAHASGASADLAGNPVTLDPSGRGSVLATATGMGGTYTVIARVAGAADVAFTLTNLGPTIALTPPAGSNPVGQAATITATVTNEGGVPLAGIPLSFRIIAGPNAGAMGSTDPADGRTDAGGQVRFSYVGAGGPGTDTIVATVQLASGVTIAAPGASVVWTVAPTVVSLHRLGIHRQPTTLVLTFSQPLDPARAVSRANYHLAWTGPDHRLGTKDDRAIRIRSIRYNAAADTVTLRPIRRLPLRRTFWLTVVGTPPGGLTSTTGVPLTGGGTGRPGSDYLAAITRKSLVLPTRHPGSPHVRGGHARAGRPTGAHRAT